MQIINQKASIKKLEEKNLLNEIINERNQFLIHRLPQETFHHSNTSGKYLASQIKRNKERTAITSIRNSAGKLTNSPVEINKIFQDYYTKLYSSDLDPNQEDIIQFLDNTILPKLNIEQVNTLELPITEKELHSALKSMQNNKAPGPDASQITTFPSDSMDTQITTFPSDSMDTQITTFPSDSTTFPSDSMDSQITTFPSDSMDIPITTFPSDCMDSQITTFPSDSMDSQITTIYGQSNHKFSI